MASKLTRRIPASGIRRIFEMAREVENPLDFSLGQAHFEVPEPLQKAAEEVIRAGRNGYTITQGIPQLHDFIQRDLKTRLGLEPESVLVTSGATGALLLACLAVLDPGDEVLVPSPCFVLYRHHVTVSGATTRFIDTYPDFRLTPERLEAALTPKARLLILNNPCNPTGVALTPEELKAIADICHRNRIRVVADEVYERFTYDLPHTSFLKFDREAVLVNAFSKTFAVAGWRLGYAAGPRSIIEAMTTLQQVVYVCPPTPAQFAIARAAEACDVEALIRPYARRRDLVYDSLKEHFELVRPQGAFYAFPRTPWGTDLEFVEEAIRKRVLVVPGSSFSDRNTHFRISFAAPFEMLREGMQVLQDLAGKGGP